MDRAAVTASGVREVLTKPVSYATLVAAIRRVIGSPQDAPPAGRGSPEG
jgi:DNA-binding response OmpR family regulator